MNNKDYLNQIASDTRGAKATSGGLLGGLGFSPKMVKIIIGIVIVSILIIIFGLIASSGKGSDSDRDIADRLYLRTKNVSQILDRNNSHIKSPELRSITNSFKSIISELNYRISTSLKEDYGSESPDEPASESTLTSETDYADSLTKTLDNARISGTLDRAIANEVSFNISMIISMEQDIAATTKYDNLKDYLATSEANLSQIQSQLENYSVK